MIRLAPSACLALALALLAGSPVRGEETPYIMLASTTSTRDSGLLADLTARFEARTGVAVRVIAVGTGRALEHGRRGDVDALLVHDRASEDAFVATGHGLFRRDVMYNDFVIVGPAADPAGVREATSATDAVARIAATGARFASRADDSGTHKAERRLWEGAEIDPGAHSGKWYLETGSGMGATLNLADELGAYTLSDRGTWLAHRKRSGLAILFQNDPPLHNPYGVIVVNPERHPGVKVAHASAFADWLVSAEGQAAIDAFERDGQQLFFANAAKTAAATPPAPGGS